MPQGNGQGSGNGLDTGTGGFPIDTSTPGAPKAYTLDTGSDANSNAPTWSPGSINVSDTPVDVSPTTKRTLASYLSRTTLGMSPSSPGPVGNKYPIVNGPSEDPVASKLQDASGFVPPLTPISSGQPAFSTISQPIMSPTPEAQISFNRGRSTPAIGVRDGNDLLSSATDGFQPFPPASGEINRADLKDPLKTYTTKVLKINPYGQELKFLTPTNALDEKIDVKKQLDLLKRTSASGVNPMNRGSFYPINVEIDSTGSPVVSVTKLTDTSGYPASLRSMVNDNQLNFRDLGAGRSNDSVDLKILRGRQQSSSGITTDGNSLLPFAADVLVGAQEYPPAGTVNVTKLSDTSPVKPYTDKLTQKNEYSEAIKFSPSSEASKRPAGTLEATPLSYPATQEDITDNRRRTLRDYMSKSTKEGGGKNAYSLDSSPENVGKLRDTNGNPMSPYSSANSERHVTSDLPASRAADVEKLRIGKSSKNSDGVDGNKLLKEVTPSDKIAAATVQQGNFTPQYPAVTTANANAENPAVKYSKTLLVNRFNPELTHETSPTPLGFKAVDDSNKGVDAYRFAKPREYKKGTSVANRDVSFSRLAQVGNALTQRAGLELGSNAGGYNPTRPTAQGSALLPGTTQLGVEKVNFSDLTAESVINDLSAAGIKDNLLIDPMSESWGSLNNVNDEYSGISAFGMQLLAVALAIGALIAVGVFFFAFKWSGSFGEQKDTRDEVGRLPFGAYVYDPAAAVDPNNILSLVTNPKKLNLWRLLGISVTKNDLDKCVGTGALSFFGVTDTDTSTAGAATVAALKAAIPVSSSPGYYAIAARNVTRSFLLIAEYFKKLGNAFGSGLVAGLKQLFALLDVFRNSKFFKMLNVFAQLGDTILFETSPARPGSDDKSRGPGLRHKSKIDEEENYVYGKGRIKTEDINVNKLTHAWSAYMAPDYLMTNKFFGAKAGELIPPSLSNNFLPNTERKLGGTKQLDVTTADVDGGRISDSDREKIEQELESQYVPFYFHDVRTNEFVSFHAFLASLSDDYSVAYDTIDAFGRVEPIKIYKSTTRKIGLSFYVAALNQNDFDTMWVKINKLLTMIYPQFDAGQQLTKDKYKFTVPFSQTMRAPPFVRLRIGDLITSNYSKFNLARIFGYDNSGTQFMSGSSAINADGIVGANIIAAEANVRARYRTTVGKSFKLPLPDNRQITVNGKTVDVLHSDVPIFVIKERVGDDKVKGEISGVKKITENKQDFPTKPLMEVSIAELLYPTDQDAFAADVEKEIYQNDLGKIANFKGGATEFLDVTKNAVAKSFRSSGGRGLGGFIESMNFDWYDRVTWETAENDDPKLGSGRKAPRMCKISISFTPSHDIAPGLDNNGINRAPVYNVRQVGGGSRW